MSDYTSEDQIPYGYCHCGCGQKTNIANLTSKRDESVKGQPSKYIKGHSKRYSHQKQIEVFWSKINKDGSIPVHMPHLGKCWEWTGAKATRGYGNVKWEGHTNKVHRVIWQLTYGEIPSGLEICHSCDNTSCCNPKHLFLGTHQDNMDDRERKNRGNRDNRNIASGEQHYAHKLTSQQVSEIRQRYAIGGISQSKLAAEYGVCRSNISIITTERSWKN